LPPAAELGSNVVAADVFADEIYWVEWADSVVVRGPSGALWQQPGPFVERRAYYLVAGDAGVVMSSNGLENCGDTIWIHDGGSEVLQLLSAETCDARLLDQGFGGVLFEAIAAPQGQHEVQRFDLTTRTIEPAFALGDDTLWSIGRTETEAFSLAASPSGKYIAAFDRDRPTSLRVVTRDVWSVAGLAVVDGDVLWTDNGYSREGATLHRAPTSATEAQGELVARVHDGYVRGIAFMNGAVWIAPESEPALIRVELNGSTSRFEVPYLTSALYAVGGQLAVRTIEPDQTSRLLVQPID
jgi:hypothetical protein